MCVRYFNFSATIFDFCSFESGAAAVSSALIKQKSMFSDCQELAKCLARIYTQNDDDQAWPNAKSKLKHSETAKAYKDCWVCFYQCQFSSFGNAEIVSRTTFIMLFEAVQHLSPLKMEL